MCLCTLNFVTHLESINSDRYCVPPPVYDVLEQWEAGLKCPIKVSPDCCQEGRSRGVMHSCTWNFGCSSKMCPCPVGGARILECGVCPLTLLPVLGQLFGETMKEELVFKTKATEFYQSVLEQFKSIRKALSPEEMVRPSIQNRLRG